MTVTTRPVVGDIGDNPRLYLEVLDPNGTVLAAADVDRTARSQGTDGLRVVLEEVHHVFTIEDRYNITSMTVSRFLRLGDFTGQPVNVVRSALDFVRHCHQPSTGRMSVRHTPPELGTADQAVGFEWAGETQRALNNWFDIIDSLALIDAGAIGRSGGWLSLSATLGRTCRE